jgi:putative NADH-flavin reductase
MNVVIFGAGGRTGRELVRQALSREHVVTAFVRNPSTFQADTNPVVAVGDVTNRAAVERAVARQEAVICALGAKSLLLRQPQLTLGMHNIVLSMEEAGVRRLVYLSADTVHEARRELNPLRRYVLIPILLHNTAADHELDEAMIRQSHLDWIIVRPPVLTDGPRTGTYRSGAHLAVAALIPQISRADVADFMLDQLTNDVFLHQTPIVAH